MKSFRVDLSRLLTVAAAVLDEDAVLLDANAGFLRLLPDSPSPIGARTGRFFLQPSFSELLRLARATPEGYEGRLTIGDPAGRPRALRGRVWQSAPAIRLLAESDIVDLEVSIDSLLDLNRSSLTAERSLAGANVELKRNELRIVEESMTDPLTGLGNRRKLDESLAAEISRARRNGGVLSGFIADIDHFKKVNDEHGHAEGDRVLARVGAGLKAAIRVTDTAARFGGEEFVVLMPHVGIAQALVKAERFRAFFADNGADPDVPLTLSFGVGELSPGEDRESFFRRLDAALYRAKAEGRNRVVAARLPEGAEATVR